MKKKPSIGPSRLAALWAWIAVNPRTAAIAVFTVLGMITVICAKPDVKTTKAMEETRTSAKAASADSSQTILITNEQWQEYHDLRVEVQSLRKQEQTWKRTTKKRHADGSEEETTDEGSSKNEEAIQTLTTRLDQMAETLAMTEDSLRSSRQLVDQQASLIAVREQQIVQAKRPHVLAGLAMEMPGRENLLWGSLGVQSQFLGDMTIATRAELPVVGPFGMDKIRFGIEVGF